MKQFLGDLRRYGRMILVVCLVGATVYWWLQRGKAQQVYVLPGRDSLIALNGGVAYLSRTEVSGGDKLIRQPGRRKLVLRHAPRIGATIVTAVPMSGAHGAPSGATQIFNLPNVLQTQVGDNGIYFLQSVTDIKVARALPTAAPTGGGSQSATDGGQTGEHPVLQALIERVPLGGGAPQEISRVAIPMNNDQPAIGDPLTISGSTVYLLEPSGLSDPKPPANRGSRRDDNTDQTAQLAVRILDENKHNFRTVTEIPARSRLLAGRAGVYWWSAASDHSARELYFIDNAQPTPRLVLRLTSNRIPDFAEGDNGRIYYTRDVPDAHQPPTGQRKHHSEVWVADGASQHQIASIPTNMQIGGGLFEFHHGSVYFPVVKPGPQATHVNFLYRINLSRPTACEAVCSLPEEASGDLIDGNEFYFISTDRRETDRGIEIVRALYRYTLPD